MQMPLLANRCDAGAAIPAPSPSQGEGWGEGGTVEQPFTSQTPSTASGLGRSQPRQGPGGSQCTCTTLSGVGPTAPVYSA